MKTINRLLASVVMVTATGFASAQGAAKEFYVEAGLAPTKISSVEVTPVVARATLGKNINENLSIEGVYAFTAVKDSLTVLNTNVDISVAGYGIYLKPKFEVTKGTEVFGRIGYTSAKYTASAGNISTSGDRVNSLSYGAGVQTEISKDWYAQADYMVFSDKDGDTAKGFGVSVGYRF